MIKKELFVNPNGFDIPYLVYLPDDYDESKTYPMIVFLHGYGETGPTDGSKVEKVAVHGPFFEIETKGRAFPCIIVGPQCPETTIWYGCMESLIGFVKYAIDKYPADKKRVSLTGLSMGGYGSFLLGQCAPELFSAVAPVCGGGVCWYGFKLKDKPVWAFHGDCDGTVPPYESLNMVKHINQAGGHAKVTFVPGVGHDVWRGVYADSEIYDWLLSQENKDI